MGYDYKNKKYKYTTGEDLIKTYGPKPDYLGLDKKRNCLVIRDFPAAIK